MSNCVTCNAPLTESGCQFIEAVNRSPMIVRVVYFCCPDCLDHFIKCEGHTPFYLNAQYVEMK